MLTSGGMRFQNLICAPRRNLRNISLTLRIISYYCRPTALEHLYLMVKRSLPKPTDGELSILRVLWHRGPSTVREVLEELNKIQDTGYTTVLKMMQIMTEKGLLERDNAERTHVFKPRLAEDDTQRQLVNDLLERAFGGSAKKLVLHALSATKASPRELGEIRR